MRAARARELISMMIVAHVCLMPRQKMRINDDARYDVACVLRYSRGVPMLSAARVSRARSIIVLPAI